MKDVVALMEREVETSAHVEVGSFTIMNDAHMFRILISSLYSDKPRAVVRELWTNARDSHIDAGKPDEPFYCQLPTRWDPSFSVRDRGTSLTHDQIMNLYTTVGLSTKKDSNSTVGKFGLGSKVPFSYTDSFTVTAIQDGIKRTYNAYMDSSNCPKIALFGSEPTDEDTGIEVSFPVSPDDIEAFHVAAQRVALGFPVVPSNNRGLTGLTSRMLFSGDGWTMYAPDYEDGLTGAFIRQGCVMYPLDYKPFASDSPIRVLSGEAMILDMPIGTVDITPSRESISYDATTTRNIEAKFEEILDVFVQQATDKILKSTTLWQAMTARFDTLRAISNPQLREAVSKRLTWKGKRVDDSITISRQDMQMFDRQGFKLREVFQEGCRSNRRWEIGSSIASQRTFVQHQRVAIIHWGKDAPKNLKLRLQQAMRTLYNNGIYSILVAGNSDLTSFGARAFYAKMGRPDADYLQMVDLSKIEIVVEDYTRTLAALRVWRNHQFEISSNPPTADCEDIYYVPTFKTKPVINGKEVGTEIIAKVWSRLQASSLIPMHSRLVSIPASRKDLAKKMPPDWISLEDAFAEAVEQHFDAAKAMHALAINDLTGSNRFHRWSNLATHLSPAVSQASPLKDMLSRLASWNEKQDGMELSLDLARTMEHFFSADESLRLLNGFAPSKVSTVGFWNIVTEIKRGYPLIGEVLADLGYLSDKLAVSLNSYVVLVDAQASTQTALAA